MVLYSAKLSASSQLYIIFTKQFLENYWVFNSVDESLLLDSVLWPLMRRSPFFDEHNKESSQW